MLLVMPPADVTEAVSPAAVKEWTRDSAASNRVHPAGFLSGTTRNSMGALTVGGVGADACGADACCVEHPAVTATAMATTQFNFRMGSILSDLAYILRREPFDSGIKSQTCARCPNVEGRASPHRR